MQDEPWLDLVVEEGGRGLTREGLSNIGQFGITGEIWIWTACEVTVNVNINGEFPELIMMFCLGDIYWSI